MASEEKDKRVAACRHCARVKYLEGRGLCRGCYRRESTRELYPPKYRYTSTKRPAYRCGRCRKLRRVWAAEGVCSSCHIVMEIMAAADHHQCLHCVTGVASTPRGLCRRCFYTPGVKRDYPVITPGFNDKKPVPAEPTTAVPGSLEKILVMAARVARGEQPHHPRDFRYSEPLIEKIGVANNA